MKIHFDIKAKPGLRVIKEIIDGKVVWVKGYNGVGKSMSAKLLEMISDDYVFDNASEFESLKKALEKADITITFDSGKQLAVTLTPSEWLFDHQSKRVYFDSVAKFFEDNGELEPHEFKSKFQARIIRGNENLSTQVKAIISDTLDYIRNLETNATMLNSEVKQLFIKLDHDLTLNKIGEYDEKITNIEEYNNRLDKINTETESLTTQVNLLSDLLSNQEKIDTYNKNDASSLSVNIEQLEQIVREHRKTLEEFKAKRDGLIGQKQSLLNAGSSQDEVLDEIKNRQDELVEVKEKIIYLFNKLELDIKLNSGDQIVDYIHAKQKELATQDEALSKKSQEQQLIQDTIDMQFNILHASNPQRYSDGIVDQIIATGSSKSSVKELAITVNELRQMVTRKRAELVDKGKQAEFQDYSEKLRRIEEDQTVLDNLLTLIKDRRRIEKRITTLDKELSRKAGDISKYKEITSQISFIDAQMEEVQQEIGKASKHLEELKILSKKLSGYPSITELAHIKANLIANLKLDNTFESSFENISLLLQQKRDSLVVKQNDGRECREQLDNLQIEKESIETNFAKLLNKVNSDKKLAPSFETIGCPTDTSEIEIFRQYRDQLYGFIDKIGVFEKNITFVRKLNEALLEIQSGVSSNLKKFDDSSEIKEIEQIYNKEIKTLYNNSTFLKYVFEGFDAINSFDIRKNTITLATGEIEQIKPITTFSTGQKAFAFSIAMMNLVFRPEVENKVLILDEFGALLDYVREDILMKQITSNVLNNLTATKVIILLPVRERLDIEIENIARQIQLASDEDRKQILRQQLVVLKECQRQLQENGYFEYNS